ncbi:hypothetical protein C2G38_2183892 [Gigaspora rosea]|uniref:Uncharacterized protein n=1 Tax=Gigaspora rosea TaxID=44941 RepID=A0A397V820_9GLOM|nr:hypothetical protein C2G38_2183892 [Gigaspora rosea]
MDTKRGKLFHVMAQLFFIIRNEPEKLNARPKIIKIIEEYLRNTLEIPINFQEIIKRNSFSFLGLSLKNQKFSLIQYQECLLKMKEYVREHNEDIMKIHDLMIRFMQL